MGLHVADLHRGGVRAQQRATIGRRIACDGSGEVQRVLHVARRVFRRHVERVETVPFVLDLRAFDDRKTHAGEDFLEPLAHDRERVAMSEQRLAPGQRDIDPAAGTGAGAADVR